MFTSIVKLVVLLCGGKVRCGICGHRVNIRTIHPHMIARHPQAMGR